jgi:acyl-CoA synthetase (AMP-forming)/AMP-acid ligase II
VGVYLPNCIEIVELELACYKAALVKAPINARLAPLEVAEVIANSEATLIVTTAERAEASCRLLKGAAPRLLLLDAAEGAGSVRRRSPRQRPLRSRSRVRADELAVLHYTSGSSGVLKAAMQTFGNRLAQLRKFLMRADSLRPGDLLGLVGPITHASGMQLVPALCSGATIRLFDGFEPGASSPRCARARDPHLHGADHDQHAAGAGAGPVPPLPDLKRLGYGAAPMAPARILQAMDVFGPVLSQGYGAGETTSGVCGLSVEDHLFARAAMPERLASCGRPFPGVARGDRRRRRPARGHRRDRRDRGGGPDVFAGYWRAPELTAEVLKNGRYHTGDLARADDDGYIYIVDRKKDMVISGGFNVYPSEVEAVLYQHAAVDEACVFACPTTSGARPWPRTSCSSPAPWRSTRRRSTPSAPSGSAASSGRAASSSSRRCPRTPTARSRARPSRRRTGPAAPARQLKNHTAMNTPAIPTPNPKRAARFDGLELAGAAN